MSKTVREVEVKFYNTYLDALLDSNGSTEIIELEDEVYLEALKSKIFSGEFRLKSFHRQGNYIEKVYLKIS